MKSHFNDCNYRGLNRGIYAHHFGAVFLMVILLLFRRCRFLLDLLEPHAYSPVFDGWKDQKLKF